jgi:putative ABC transport system permease protein
MVGLTADLAQPGRRRTIEFTREDGALSALGLLHDLRHALRRIRNSPGFSTVAIATMAFAIGANTAMFSFVNGILLKPLPYPDPDGIVRVLEKLPSGGPNAISTLTYLDWARENTVFEYLAAEAGWRATLGGGSEPELVRGARVSARYFDIFGVKAARGRTFGGADDQPGKAQVVLIAYALWERRFNADPDLVGRDILLNEQPYTVIGILPKGGPFDRAAAQVWVPLALASENMTRDFRWLGATARLKPGVTLERARVEMDVMSSRIADAYPESNRGWGISIERLSDVLVGRDTRNAVTVLFVATALVLLMACANLANLALARGISRQGEMAVRGALGASRGQLIRLFLIESVAIALLGGFAGIGVGYAAMKWLQSLLPHYALPPAVDISMDASALLFAVIVAVVAGVLLGLVSAAQSTNRSLVGALNESTHRATAGRQGRGARRVLVVAEVALAFVLLVASGLLTRSFIKLLDIDPGFDSTNVLTASVPIHHAQHPDPAELNTYLSSIRAAVEAVPGVRTTALTSVLPLEGWGFGMPYAIADRGSTDRANRRLAFFKIVSPTYFDSLGIKLRGGRLLGDQDKAGAPHVVVINETLADREFPGENPIGRRILIREMLPGRTQLGEEIAWEIVGVIAGEKITGLGDAISAGVYVSNQQSPTYAVSLIVRGHVAPEFLMAPVRAAVAGVNRNQALGDLRTLDEIVQQSTMGNRVMSRLFALFASIALLLAALGVYGVMAYNAAQRTHEMGVRAALGATPGRLRGLLFRDGLRLTLMGLALGLVATFAATRVMSSMLYGVSARDPLTIAAVAVVLSVVAGLACFLPAWRISSVDPMDVLRNR